MKGSTMRAISSTGMCSSDYLNNPLIIIINLVLQGFTEILLHASNKRGAGQYYPPMEHAQDTVQPLHPIWGSR